MAETTFCDGLEPCEINGHDLRLDNEWHEIAQFLYRKTEVCKKCNIIVKHTRYKWMPETMEYIKYGK